jgi:hypothetical protein
VAGDTVTPRPNWLTASEVDRIDGREGDQPSSDSLTDGVRLWMACWPTSHDERWDG